MHTKPFTLALVAMLTIVFIGCGDSKKPRAKRTSSPSGETDKATEKQPEKSATEVADASKSTPAPGREGWGNLKGKFIYNGKAPTPISLDTTKEAFCTKEKIVDEQLVVGADSGLANVVVWVKNADVKIHPDYEARKKDKVIINNEKCRFNPHIMGYWTGQPLAVKNSDPVAHNTNVTLPDSGAGFNESITADKTADRTPIETAELRPCPVKCNMHPWMSGYIVVQPHPYVAISASDGTFELKNLPAGTELEFIAWQESAGYVKPEIDGKDAGWAHDRKTNKKYSFKYTIKPGDNDLGTLKLDPSQFKPL
jgi:hypothetical protein